MNNTDEKKDFEGLKERELTADLYDTVNISEGFQAQGVVAPTSSTIFIQEKKPQPELEH